MALLNLKTKQYNMYSAKSDGHEDIIESIIKKTKEFDEYQDWITYDYCYSKFFIYLIKDYSKINIKKLINQSIHPANVG